MILPFYGVVICELYIFMLLFYFVENTFVVDLKFYFYNTNFSTNYPTLFIGSVVFFFSVDVEFFSFGVSLLICLKHIQKPM